MLADTAPRDPNNPRLIGLRDSLVMAAGADLPGAGHFQHKMRGQSASSIQKLRAAFVTIGDGEGGRTPATFLNLRTWSLERRFLLMKAVVRLCTASVLPTQRLLWSAWGHVYEFAKLLPDLGRATVFRIRIAAALLSNLTSTFTTHLYSLGTLPSASQGTTC